MIEIGLGAKEEEASNADRSHQPCAHCQDYINYEKWKKLVSPVHKKWSNKSEKRSWLPATGIESSCHPGTSSTTYINQRLL